MQPNQKFQYAVIGAGIYGLSVAYWLSKNQCSVALFEKYTLGHANGSSHGSSRISRGSYANKLYTQMHQISIKEYWPKIQEDLETKFMFKNQFLAYIDDEGIYNQFADPIKENQRYHFLNKQQTHFRYPKMPDIPFKDKVIADTEAAVISSQRFYQSLEQYLRSKNNVVIFENTNVKDVRQNSKIVLVECESQLVLADKVVLACGRWVKELKPELSDLVEIIPQTTAYLKMQNPLNYQIGKFPSFAQISKQHIFYCTPDFKTHTLKIGEHKNENIQEENIQVRLQNWGKKIFEDQFKGVQFYEQCFYTTTKNEEFIIDWLDQQCERVLLCSCCSGHGFKFTPLIGKIISDLLIKNQSIEIFEKNRHMFQIMYHRGVNLQD